MVSALKSLRPGLPGLAAITLLALGLRLAWALLVPVHPVSDSNIYMVFAQEILAGHGYAFPHAGPTVYWAVGPSALYAACFALFGVHGWVVSAVNLLMGCGLVAGIHELARHRFNARIASIAGLIAACWPVWIEFTTVLNSELPFSMFIVAALLVREEQRLPGWARILLSTILLVLAAYMRPTALPLIVLLPLLDGALRKPGRAAAHLTLAIALAALLIAPWAARNQAHFGKPVLISANFGPNLWMGNNPDSNGGYMKLPDIDAPNEVARDAYFKEQAVQFIKANPGRYVLLSLKRLQLSFDRETIGVAWNAEAIPPVLQAPLKLASSAYWLAAFALAAIGVVLFLIEKPMRLFDPMILTAGLFAAVATLVVGMDRYHMPMMPFIAIFAACAIQWLHDRRRGVTEGH